MVNYVKYGITEEFQTCDLDTLKQDIELSSNEIIVYDNIYRLGEKWYKTVAANQYKVGLFLYGDNGTGKSSFGCYLMRKFLKKGKYADRMTMAKVQETFFKDWKIPEIALRQSPLFLEEIGKEYTTKNEHSSSILEYILKYRVERRFPTIISANASIKDIAIRYGATVESLLRGRYMPMQFPPINLRARSNLKNIQDLMGVQ